MAIQSPTSKGEKEMAWFNTFFPTLGLYYVLNSASMMGDKEEERCRRRGEKNCLVSIITRPYQYMYKKECMKGFLRLIRWGGGGGHSSKHKHTTGDGSALSLTPVSVVFIDGRWRTRDAGIKTRWCVVERSVLIGRWKWIKVAGEKEATIRKTFIPRAKSNTDPPPPRFALPLYPCFAKEPPIMLNANLRRACMANRLGPYNKPCARPRIKVHWRHIGIVYLQIRRIIIWVSQVHRPCP